MKYKVWVDRLEEDMAVLEYKDRTFSIPKELLGEVKDGDCITMHFEKDDSEKDHREKDIKNLMDELWK